MLRTIIIGLIITVSGGVILVVVLWVWKTKIYLRLTRLLKKLGGRLKLIFRRKETPEEREAKEEQEKIFDDDLWKNIN